MSFIFFCRKKSEATLRVLFIYILYSWINDHIIFYLLGNTDYDNQIHHFLLSLFTFVEFTIFALILSALQNGRLRKRIIHTSIILFGIFCIYTYIMYSFFPSDNSLAFDSYPASIENLLLIIFCIFFFYEQLSGQPTFVIYKYPRFWIVMGIMVYTSLNFFLFLESSIASVSVISEFWDINLISNILKNIIFAIAFVINDENQTKTLPERKLPTI